MGDNNVRGKASFITVLGIVFSFLIGSAYSLNVGAFSAYGAGTLGNPYRIATCSQLQEIDDNLGAYYTLVANIDCSAATFHYLAASSPFTGTLDGQNHTISHLTIDDAGLFNQTNGATIKNIFIDSGSVSGAYVASFVQSATDTTFTNIHSAMDVSNSAGYTGGLVGELSGTASISQSSFSGTLSSTGYSGGLVGAMWDAGTSISDSFSSGSLNSHSAYNGGIVGGYFNGSINRVYSSMAINTNNNPYNGGLVGDSQVTVDNSFSAVTRTGSGSYYGAIVGLNIGGPYTNDYFDQTTNGTSSCFGLNTTTGCTAVNTSNTTPNYFKNNSTNAPLDTWNFSSIWETTSGYPTLRNIANFTSPTTPNSGDADGDGIQDSYQANVLSLQDGGGKWTTVTVPSASNCTLGNGQSSTNADTTFNPYSSLTAFYVYCPTTGATVTVSVIYDQAYTNPILRYYNPNTNAYSTITGATFDTVTIGGVAKTRATYAVTDGGTYDSDGVANGLIKDPIGLAQNNTVSIPGAPNTGVGPSNGALIINLLLIACIGILTTAIILWPRRKQG